MDRRVKWAKANPNYIQYKDDALIHNQIETINQFVSFLIENSEDLNPEFSAAVDKHFWDLV